MSEIRVAINANFHGSHSKSMGYVAIQRKHMNNGNKKKKNVFFVEANVMNISAKFQLHPPYGFRSSEDEISEYFFFTNLAFWFSWQPNSAGWTKFISLVEDY